MRRFAAFMASGSAGAVRPGRLVAGGAPMIRSGPGHGRFATLVLEGERLHLVVVPALGARVVSDVDCETGRDWLVQGEPPADGAAAAAWAAPEAAFTGAVAYGWDECLPTVAPCPDPVDPARPALRDHGDAWGRPANVTETGGALVAEWEGMNWPYRLRREMRVAGPALRTDYLLENRGSVALPFLYSMHPLLALPAGARIEVGGLTSVLVSHAAGLRLSGLPRRVPWPRAIGSDGEPFAFDLVRAPLAGTAVKLYGGSDGAAGDRLPGQAAVTLPDGSGLELAWSPAALPALGLWLDDGGWPAAGGRVQHAIEPTTAPDDDLATAVADDRAMWVEAGGRVTWTATWRVRRPGEAREPAPVE